MSKSPRCCRLRGRYLHCCRRFVLCRACGAEGHAAGRHDPVLVFDAQTSEPVELDLRGSRDDVLRRLPEAATPEPDAPRGPGRPKLGVVAREVTLLPRHWDWLGRPARRRFGGATQARRKRHALEHQQGPHPHVAERGLQIHVGDGGKPAWFRRSVARFVCGRRAEVQPADFSVAERRSRSPADTCGRRHEGRRERRMSELHPLRLRQFGLLPEGADHAARQRAWSGKRSP